MATFISIPSTDLDFKSPIDETLMLQLMENDQYLFDNLGGGGGGGGGPTQWKVNGPLSVLRGQIASIPAKGYNLDGSIVSTAQAWSRVRLALREVGTGGQVKIDIKRHLRTNHTITSIAHQMILATQAVGRLGSPILTQAISLRTPSVATQSIARTKTQLDIQDIISLGSSRWRLNIEGGILIDSDWKVGQSILISSATNATNNKQVTIDSINDDGHPSIIFTSATGVQEINSPAVVNLQMFTYTYINPVDSDAFFPEEIVIFATHTTAANNGQKTIARVNDSGNNIIIYNTTAGAIPQAGAVGTVQTTRWVYTYGAPVLTTDYFVGELILAAAHTTAANNGSFLIRAINDGGNNIVVTNTAGVNQAGAVGNVNTHRWVYSFLTDPSLGSVVGDLFSGFTHTSGGNNVVGADIKELNRLGLNNLVIYNPSGVVQGGAVGSVRSRKTIVSFATDVSASYIVGRSFATLKNCFLAINDGIYYEVVEINRGGGANYNIVIENSSALTSSVALTQAFAKGQVDYESRSLFSTLPVLVVNAEQFSADEPDFGGTSAVFYPGNVVANSIIAIDVLELPTGTPQDLSIDLT
jgi:hypothetical protein